MDEKINKLFIFIHDFCREQLNSTYSNELVELVLSSFSYLPSISSYQVYTHVKQYFCILFIQNKQAKEHFFNVVFCVKSYRRIIFDDITLFFVYFKQTLELVSEPVLPEVQVVQKTKALSRHELRKNCSREHRKRPSAHSYMYFFIKKPPTSLFLLNRRQNLRKKSSFRSSGSLEGFFDH